MAKVEKRMTRRTIERSSPSGADTSGQTDYRSDLADLWEAGYEVVDSSRRILSDLIIGVGEVIAPSSYYSRRVEREWDVAEDGGRQQAVHRSSTRKAAAEG